MLGAGMRGWGRDASAELEVALVGREREGDENLALRYLAAAVDQARGRAEIFGLGEPAQLPRIARDVAGRRPLLVGISMSDSDAAIDGLAFVAALRRAGYTGHVTTGGALATLGRHELLARHPGLDSVIRHAGELPLVQLGRRLAAGEPFDDVAGLTTRRGDGPPAPVLDDLPLRLRPMRPRRLPRLLGVPMARVLASRGCPGRCSYCGPAALQQAAVQEGTAAGLSPEALRCAGVGGARRRLAPDVAEELAALYHERGARFFHLLDDNLLFDGSRSAGAWLAALHQRLHELGVRDAAFSLQIESTTIDERVAHELARLGVIRVALGVEALTQSGLRSLGRSGEAAGKRASLQALSRRGIVVVFNSLMVHPEATVSSIEQELAALSEVDGVHFDALALAVYGGTDIWRHLRDEGRVQGGLLAYRFEAADPAVTRFRSALIRLRLGAIGRYGANVLAHDVAVNLALARRLQLPGYGRELEGELGGALRAINAARIRAWQQALALADERVPMPAFAAAVEALVCKVRHELCAPVEAVATVQRQLERAERGGERVGSGLLVRSSIAATFTLLMAGSAVACGGSTSEDPGPVGGAGGAVTSGGTVDGGSGGTGGAAVGGTGGSAVGGSGGTAAGCSTEEISQQINDALYSSACPECDYTVLNPYGLVIDEGGNVTDVVTVDGSAVPAEVRACYLEGLAGETFPCLTGDELWHECVVCLF